MRSDRLTDAIHAIAARIIDATDDGGYGNECKLTLPNGRRVEIHAEWDQVDDDLIVYDVVHTIEGEGYVESFSDEDDAVAFVATLGKGDS